MANKTKCDHSEIRASEQFHGFSVPVATYEDHANRAAHGGITYTQTCCKCGAERPVNQNQHHYEYGPWGPDLATREEADRQRRAKELQEREATEDAAVKAAGIEVVKVVGGGEQQVQVGVRRNHQMHLLRLSEIEEAANQEDNGDGLVPTYRGILRQAGQLMYDQDCCEV